MTSYWTMRFAHESETILVRYIEFLKTCNIRVLTCQEGEDDDDKRDHTHTIFEINENTISKKSLAEKIKKMFNLQGNKAFSWKSVTDVDGFCAYVCKGIDKDTMPKILVNTLENDIEKSHSRYWQKNSELKEKVFKEKIKRKTISWTQEVVEYAVSEIGDTEMDMNNYAHKQWVLEIVLRKYGTKMKGFDGPILAKVVWAIWNAVLKSDISRKPLMELMMLKVYQEFSPSGWV